MALTPPAAWNYAYKYNATTDQFELTNYAGDKVNVPVYTRTADSTYFNYTYTGSGNDTLPFEVTLTFNRSNTTWKSYGGGYTSDDTKIGSDATVGTIVNKTYLNINNNTPNNYIIYYDNSGTLGTTPYRYFIDNEIIKVEGTQNLFFYSTNLINLYVPSFSSIYIYSPADSRNYYLSAFYLKDLGVSASYTAGYNARYLEGTTAMKIFKDGVIGVKEIDETIATNGASAKLLVGEIEEG